MKQILFIILFILFSNHLIGQSKKLSVAETFDLGGYDNYIYKVEELGFMVRNNGSIINLDSTELYQINLEPYTRILGVSYYVDCDTFYLILDITDELYGWGNILKFSNDFSLIYSYDNIPPGVDVGKVRNNILYSGGFGTIFCFNLYSGELVWHHFDLYQKYEMERMKDITFLNETILFTAIDPNNIGYRRMDYIIFITVDIESGNIIEVEKSSY